MKALLTRHGGVIISISVALTGIALWALLVTKLEFGQAEAALVTGLALLSVAQLHLYRERTRASTTIKSELDGIMALSHDLSGDIAALREDVSDMRNRIGERNFLHADKIANQVEAMDQVVQRFEQVQDERLKTEERIVGEVGLLADTVRRKMKASPPAAAAAPRPAADESAQLPGEQAGEEPQATSQPEPAAAAAVKLRASSTPSKPDLAGRVAGAINDSRIDLYLQPIVTLPQRKVRYYEALTRLRDEDGHIITPGDY
ncbi:MAG: EAL domain-containing protein, partial [Rhizobiales bacterium]|nr:EAL domain-containing protein [Hyphomicrobiales bacterium]